MYLSNGELDPDYLMENELESDEFVEASEMLIDRAYRKATEWEMAVKSERPVDEVDDIAREAAETAYVLDRVVSDFFDAYGELSDEQVENVNMGRRAWTFVNEVGTQMQYLGKDKNEMEEGDFVLINGNNVEPFSTEFDQIETYTHPSEFIEGFSGPIRITSFEVDTDPDLDDIPEDGFDFIDL